MTEYLWTTWNLAAEMAPYLLLGFVMAGFLRAYFTEAWVQRHMGRRGMRQILKAVLIGIPLPLCSCGVLPVAAGIRAQGAQRGAVAAFAAATPQTGVDSIAATVGMLGAPFAAVRVLVALVNGMIAGFVVERLDRDQPAAVKPEPKPAGCCGAEPDSCCDDKSPPKESSCCGGEKPLSPPSCCADGEATPCCCGQTNAESRPTLAEGMRFGLLTLPRTLAGALVIGLLLAGLVSTFAPQDFFANLPGGQFGIYLGITLIALPLYVCSTGSIPMAFSFLAAGMTPGAVLIFLIAGPASSMASVTALWKIIGGRATIGYVVSIVVTAWLAAFALDSSGISLLPGAHLHEHLEDTGWFKHLSAIVLFGLLALTKLPKRFQP